MRQILVVVMMVMLMATAAFSEEVQVQPQPDPNCAFTQVVVRTQYGSYESYCGWAWKWVDGGVLKLTSPEGDKRFFSGHFEVWVWPAK